MTRTSVSPVSCDLPDDCDYKCSASYTLSVSGDSLTLTPPSSVAGCSSCSTGSGMLTGYTATGSFSTGPFSFSYSPSDGTFAVAATVNGLECTGTYQLSSAAQRRRQQEFPYFTRPECKAVGCEPASVPNSDKAAEGSIMGDTGASAITM